MIYDVFVSYSRRDSLIADEICKIFKTIGLKFFTDRNNIPPGADYVTYLEKSIKRCKFFLYISSINSYKSEWCYYELNKFLNDHDIHSLIIYKIDDSLLPKNLLSEVKRPNIFTRVNSSLDSQNVSDEQITDLDLGLAILENAKDIHIEEDDEFPQQINQKVFISHSHCDNQIAVDIYNFLNSNGISCWLDLYDITPGAPYAEAIMEGLELSNTLVVIYSKNAIKSHDMLDELQEAHTTNKNIIPFITDETPLIGQFKYYLARRQWILAHNSYKDYLDDLLLAINAN